MSTKTLMKLATQKSRLQISTLIISLIALVASPLASAHAGPVQNLDYILGVRTVFADGSTSAGV